MLELFHYVDNKLEQWARRKYKTLAQDKRRGGQWLRKMKIVSPRMFVHWRVAGATAG
jgi:RNA-directed DNA polymerase